MDLDTLRSELRTLEHRARALQPHQLDRERMLADVGAFAEHCLRATQTGAVYRPPPADLADHAAFRIDAAPTPLGEVLGELEDSIIGSGLDTSSSRFFGFIPGGPLYASALGDYLAAISNRYAGNRFSGPGATRCERALVRWFADVVGYPAVAEGDLTSGGSIANLSAIVTAREAAGLKARDYETAAVYLTSLTHHCVTKALRIAGMGEAPLRRVAMDSDYRMDPEALRSAIAEDRAAGLKPWLVVGSGGTTDLGSIDPLNALADVAAAEDLWFHVDAAYGGAFALTATGRERLAGMERSDSLIVDPHKGLFLPYGTGIVLVANGRQLYEAYQDHAPYMQDIHAVVDTDDLAASDLSPELSRHFRGLRLWMALKLHGADAFRAALEEKLKLAEYFHNRIAALPGFDVGPYPQLSIASFRYVPEQGDANTFNRRLIDALREDGSIFVTSTTIKTYFVLRFAVLGYHSHIDEVDEAIAVITTTVDRLLQG